MSIKNICFISDGYPSENRVANAFVETLVNELVDEGINCVVICPQSVTKGIAKNRERVPERYIRTTKNGNHVEVYAPKYISASVKKIGFINTAKITLHNFNKAVDKVFEKLNEKYNFDAVYGHFIFPAGIAAAEIKRKYKIPAYYAYGENTTYTIDYLGKNKTRELLNNINGVISVSSDNKRVLLENDISEEDIIGVFPNSIDNELFYKHDVSETRKRLGFPKDAIIVCFVGRFKHVKGPDRLAAALQSLDKKVYSIFIGEGEIEPSCENILFMGPLKHNEIPQYLSCADMFVLPTLAEGCCNAIVEAMACGLPVVSSDLPFNDDILDETNSIRVDPMDIQAIANAIDKLGVDRVLRGKLSEGALQKAKSLTIRCRANNIYQFMEKTR